MFSHAGKGHFYCVDARLEYKWFVPDNSQPPPSSTVFVLLHEGLGCVSMWRQFPQLLAQRTGCSVLSYSRIGYGTSDSCQLPRPLDYMEIEASRYLPEMVTGLDAENIFLLGHSDGASISAIYAADTPDPRVKGIILLAPHFFSEKISISAIKQARLAYVSGDLRQHLQLHHGDNVDCAFKGWNDAWLDPRFVHWNITHCIADIAVPILVIQGLQDQYGSIAQVEIVQQQARSPVEVCLLEQCRHAPHRDQTIPTLDAIETFVCRSH